MEDALLQGEGGADEDGLGLARGVAAPRVEGLVVGGDVEDVRVEADLLDGLGAGEDREPLAVAQAVGRQLGFRVPAGLFKVGVSKRGELAMLSCEAIREALESRLGAETGEQERLNFALCESFQATKNGVRVILAVGERSVTVWVDREDVYALAGAPRYGLSDMGVRLGGHEACLEARTRGPSARDYQMSWTLKNQCDEAMLDMLAAFLSVVYRD